MRIHYLQHVPFEGPAWFLKWAKENGHSISGTMLYRGERLPSPADFDFLIIMGGPMNIYEYEKFPWLKDEKHFLEKCLLGGKKMIGVCLGGQLLADVLNAPTAPGPHKEIGWFPIQLSRAAKQLGMFQDFPETFMAFHWHGDTFQIPTGAIPLGSSVACRNQGFIYDGQAVGFQFHLECTEASVNGLLEGCSDELRESSPHIQPASQIKSAIPENVPVINALVESMLSRWLG